MDSLIIKPEQQLELAKSRIGCGGVSTIIAYEWVVNILLLSKTDVRTVVFDEVFDVATLVDLAPFLFRSIQFASKH